jgi:peptidoglycan/xylan/chitin deacetylase (PgdA/CDA1 family)
LVSLFAVVLVAAVVIAVLASPTETRSRASVATVPPATAGLTNKPTRHGSRTHAKRSAAARATRLADQTINRVLAYTPFVRAGLPRRRVIALSFDDGPSPYTPQIVRVLTRMHAPATFFVVGQQLNYFAAGLRDELRHGFVIGDHTENHPPMNRLSAAAQYGQVDDVARRIHYLGAPFPRLFRPPYGLYDANTMKTLRRLHMLMVMWSVDPRDWLRPGTLTIVQRVLQAAQPGTIVELHDGGGDRSQTAAALPAIIRGLRRRHYELVTVPQLLRADPPPHKQRLGHLAE